MFASTLKALGVMFLLLIITSVMLSMWQAHAFDQQVDMFKNTPGYTHVVNGEEI